jgi:hypothetical protein
MDRRQTPRPEIVDGVCADCHNVGTRWEIDEYGPALRFCPCDTGHRIRISAVTYALAHQKGKAA